MTDAELLRLAALAAGLRYDGYHGTVSDAGSDYYWGPLDGENQGSGDALRLAVDLDIAIESRQDKGLTHCTWMVEDGAHIKFMEVVEPHNGNPEAATCRAIVRAAAEIGKSLEAQDGKA